MTYVRIYYTGGFIIWTSTFLMKATVYGIELQGDYYIPCLILSEEETQPIGLWGQRHKQYLKEHKQFLYTTMLIEGTLNSYLADIDRQAQERLLLLTKQIAEQENVTEKLKADNAMLWVQKMNEIQFQS